MIEDRIHCHVCCLPFLTIHGLNCPSSPSERAVSENPCVSALFRHVVPSSQIILRPAPARSRSPFLACLADSRTCAKCVSPAPGGLLECFLNSPVDGGIPTNRLHQFASDGFQRSVPENLDRAVVHFQRIVKRNFILAETQLLPFCRLFPHLLSQSDQFFDNLCGLNRSVLILSNGTL